MTFPAYNLQQYFDQCGDTTPAPAAAHQSLPRALSPPRAPAMVSPPRCAQPPTAAAAAQVPVAHAAPSYFTVTAAKQNQVLITPPASSTADSPPCSKTDRDTSSPDSGLSDENVVSVGMSEHVLSRQQWRETFSLLQNTVKKAHFVCLFFCNIHLHTLESSLLHFRWLMTC